MHRYLAAALLAITAVAVPIEERQSGPAVTIKNGTVVGSSLAGVDSFKGIPFAQPPVGQLRLKAPQSINKSFGTFNAVGVPKSCPQFITQVDKSNVPASAVPLLVNSPLLQAAMNAGEDCLTLNVQRPAGTTASSKLPVLFWIYGGGFEAGSTQIYDGSSLISRSVSQGEPIIFVAVNYRLGGFGFLAGKELASESSTNLGLRDQRLGMKWVAENIAAFGGDPSKVTIWGESAGSISVFDHTIINGGNNNYQGKPLFRAAIMNSGSVIPAQTVTSPKAQNIYNMVASAAGCSGANSLACLRSVDYTTFLNAASSVPGIFSYRSVDLSYLPRPDPSDNFFSQSPEIPVQAGRFTKVPLIIGDQKDEGTLFSLVQSNITTNAQLIEYLASYFTANPNAVADVTGLVANYPDQPLLGQPAGSPFDTGSLNNIYPQYKRLAAILGDITFTLGRRAYLDIVSPQVKSWSYLSDYLQGTPVLGTLHGSDIVVDFGITGPLVLPTISKQGYYINFCNSLNPNVGFTSPTLINWPQYSQASPQLVLFSAATNSLLADTFRKASSDYLKTRISSFRV